MSISDAEKIEADLTSEDSASPTPRPSDRRRHEGLRRFAADFAESKVAVGGAVMCLIIVLAAVFAPFITPQNPYDLANLDLMNSRLPPGDVGMDGTVFWLGTDDQGRDLYSAIIYGLRISLGVGVTAGLAALLLGTTVGLVAAYFGGRVDAMIMRVVDFQLSFPAIMLALVMLAVLGQGIDKIIIALMAVQWAYFARTVRSAGAGGAAPRIYRGRAVPRAVHAQDHLRPPDAELPRAADRGRDGAGRERDLAGGDALLPRPRDAGDAAEPRPADRQRVQVHPVRPLLDLDVPRHRPPHHHRLHQPRRRPHPRRSEPEAPAMSEPALKVENLATHFFTKAGVVKAVDGVSFEVGRGEIMGLVGESGSGKTVTGFSILGLVDPPGRVVSGSIHVGGQALRDLSEQAMRRIRGKRVAMIFQDPMMTLNPVLRIDTQMTEAILAHEPVSRKAALDRARQALDTVGIPAAAERLKAYPHQLSGGMRQRVAIATALLNRPDVIIADEPTTALDVTIQAQILNEVKTLARDFGTAFVWITHDLSVVAGLASRICVMYAGRIVETGSVDDALDRSLHPYTRGLIDSVPAMGVEAARLSQIPGMAPSLLRLPEGCAFRPRCGRETDICRTAPPLVEHRKGQAARCHHALATSEEPA